MIYLVLLGLAVMYFFSLTTLSTISVFTANIILFDSLLISMTIGFYSHFAMDLHSAYAFLLTIGVFLLLFGIQKTNIGFWVIGIIMSLCWGFVFGFIAYLCSSSDYTWFYVMFPLSTIAVMYLHLIARRSPPPV